MKKLRTLVLTIGLMTSAAAVPTVTFAGSEEVPYLNEIKKLQPDVSTSELLSSIDAISKNTGSAKADVSKQILKELKADDAQGVKEKMQKVSQKGGSGGTVSVGNSSTGNFFYTASYTAYLNHGHVGMYRTSSEIVESVPGSGVRRISTTARLVDKGDAVVKSVNTSSTNKSNAAAWANSRVGVDGYSYNFATNRTTSHYGDKNCSKLIWSAYKLNGGLDLDKDGGLGVYPRDVRDASQTSVVRYI
ncbi:hypothetical protein ACFDTO_33565 [Microbacteriaceae bacterium 4G12]